MNIVKIGKELVEDGKLILENLPFHHGETVEIIIHSLDRELAKKKAKSLAGTVYKYDNPFDSAVSEFDWDVLK